MSKSIVIVSPYEELTEKIKPIVEDMQEEIYVHTGYTDDVSGLCSKLEEEGAEVLISRGGYTKKLRDATNLPVVDIAHDLADYIQVLGRKKIIDGIVGVFSYKRRVSDIDTIKELIPIDLRQYVYDNVSDIKEIVDEAVSDGVVMGIGGYLISKEFSKRDIEYVLVASSEDSIRHAIRSAKEILRVQREEKEKSAEYKLQMENHKAVVNFSYNGILALDKDFIVTVYNPWAEKILDIPREEVMGKHIFDTVPDTLLAKVMETGTAQFDVFKKINNKQIIVNRIPIIINGKVQGLVATFQDVKTIQESERKIRRSLADKGLVANYSFDDIQTDSKIMQHCIKKARVYALSSSSVLIYGETGTGKELFAQSIHEASQRRSKPFVAINCAALPESILESELFGYEEGTFTGARKGGKIGLFELAHEGTIFLDEIGEIPLPLQAQLLRVLQEKQIRRLGSDKIIPIDVRIITATNRDLIEEVNEGRFREDLFYRINILRLSLPPLRERKEDIVKIGINFIKSNDYKLYSENKDKWYEIVSLISNYDFRGNVRELQNVLERTMVIIKGNLYEIDNYTEMLGDILDNESISLKTGKDVEKLTERQQIIDALNETNWSKVEAAKKLGLSRSTLWRKIKEYYIES